MSFINLGWSDYWQTYLEKYGKSRIVRVVEKHKNLLKTKSLDGLNLNGHLSGRLEFSARSEAELPQVGDWCVIGSQFVDETNNAAALIEEVLPRYTKISRKAAGTKFLEQVLCANVDYVFIVSSVNNDFNVNRLQRYIVLAKQGGALPIIILSKNDLGGVIELKINVPVIRTSVVSGEGVNEIKTLLKDGMTGVFVGSSGVGKSSLVNSLLGTEMQKVQTIREDDDRGRHTTTYGGLFFIPEGGMIIDTAGLREIQLLADDEKLEDLMPQVVEANCRFRDCTHTQEPGCEVLAMVESGEISASDFENYKKMKREIEFTRRKMDKAYASTEKKKWKSISKAIRLKKKIDDT